MIRLIKGFDGATDGQDEYRGEDGLIYCAKCRTPKQTRYELEGRPLLVGHVCRCRAEQLDREEAEEKLRKQRRRVQLWRAEGLRDARWHSHRFESDDRRDPNASSACRRYAERFEDMLKSGCGLLIYGKVGCGKTYLAASIANALVEQGRYVLMDTLPALTARMNAGFGAEREYWLRKISAAHLMVLDDFGIERGTDYALEQAYEVVNARYRAARPLIVTTNLSLQQLMNEQDVARRRIYDRVRERCLPLCVSGESRRLDIARGLWQEAKGVLRGEE